MPNMLKSLTLVPRSIIRNITRKQARTAKNILSAMRNKKSVIRKSFFRRKENQALRSLRVTMGGRTRRR